MVTVPVRFEYPGQWQVVTDVDLNSSLSSKLKRIIRVCSHSYEYRECLWVSIDRVVYGRIWDSYRIAESRLAGLISPGPIVSNFEQVANLLSESKSTS